MSDGNRVKVVWAISVTTLILAALLSLLYLLTKFSIIPVEVSRFANAAVVAVIVYVMLNMVTRFIRNYFSRYSKKSRIHPLIFLINLLGYFVMGVAVLAVIGVNVTSIILGGSLISVVIGLASQTVLANQFAGILLTVTRPFKVGDLVTINTWQYGGAYPTLFPKYFSVDRIEASAYTGTVTDITINYTILRLTSGDDVKLPNGVIVQAAVIVRTSGIMVKARYEVPKHIRLDSIREKIEQVVASVRDYAGELSISIDETTLNTYILMISCKFSGSDADRYRGLIFEGLMKLIEPMKES